MTYNLYLANTNGQKLSGETKIEAASLAEAKREFRAMMAAKGVDLRHCEILARL